MQLCTADLSCCGPTSTSHWVIPDVLLASAYPGAVDQNEHEKITRVIYDSGIQIFVNLIPAKELVRFNPYEPLMQRYASEDGRQIEFISFPIRDQSVHPDNLKVLELCVDLCRRIVVERQKILVHCWGGHGRTGAVIGILVGMLFDYTADDALDYNHQLHLQRQFCDFSYKGQRAQVKAVLRMYQQQKLENPLVFNLNGSN